MSYPVTNQLLTNNAYGNYGGRANGTARRVKPVVLMCVHITGNDKNLGPTAATNERNYADRAGSTGPSAHDYINRDGSVVHAIDTNYAAWSNGDLRTPKTGLAIVQTVLAFKAKGYAVNEAYAREVECVGFGTGYPVTDAQKQTVAEMIAADSRAFGIPISRATVGTHADLNTETRPNCAFPAAQIEAQLADIIARAQRIANQEADVTITRVKGEDWKARNGVLRADPDSSKPALVTLPAGSIVRSIAEVTSGTAYSWRLTDYNGAPAYLAYKRLSDGAMPDWEPLVAGGDPAVDAGLDAYIARTSDATPYSQADLDAAVKTYADRVTGMKAKTATFAADIAND